MKAIILHGRYGRHLAFVTHGDFDTQAWAQERAASLRFLGITMVTEELHDAV